MKIYNVLWKDRHSDTTAKPFTDLSKAIEYAKAQAHEFSQKYPEDYKEFELSGWLFSVEYSCEGDYLWITEHELDLQETPMEQVQAHKTIIYKWVCPSCGSFNETPEDARFDGAKMYCHACEEEVTETEE